MRTYSTVICTGSKPYQRLPTWVCGDVSWGHYQPFSAPGMSPLLADYQERRRQDRVFPSFKGLFRRARTKACRGADEGVQTKPQTACSQVEGLSFLTTRCEEVNLINDLAFKLVKASVDIIEIINGRSRIWGPRACGPRFGRTLWGKSGGSIHGHTLKLALGQKQMPNHNWN